MLLIARPRRGLAARPCASACVHGACRSCRCSPRLAGAAVSLTTGPPERRVARVGCPERPARRVLVRPLFRAYIYGDMATACAASESCASLRPSLLVPVRPCIRFGACTIAQWGLRGTRRRRAHLPILQWINHWCWGHAHRVLATEPLLALQLQQPEGLGQCVSPRRVQARTSHPQLRLLARWTKKSSSNQE